MSPINPDRTVYLTECTVNNNEVVDETSDDGYYHYGKLVRGTDVLLKKVNNSSITNYEDGNIHEMYTFSHPATEQTPALNDYRYIGNNPYNYVTFNDELWRIIGVFTVEDESGNTKQRIKITKKGSYNVWDSNGVNDWTTSSLNDYLNNEFYNSITADAKLMISKSKYYLGESSSYLTADEFYSVERSNSVRDGRDINWLGNIALMYPSDYIYTFAYNVDTNCYNDISACTDSGNTYHSQNSWFHSYDNIVFFLTPYRSSTYNVFVKGHVGGLYVNPNSNISQVSKNHRVDPTLYLSSSVKIKSGDGSEEKPYELSMN